MASSPFSGANLKRPISDRLLHGQDPMEPDQWKGNGI